MWSAFSPHLPMPCESQSRLRPRMAARLICQAAHFKRPDWLCCSPQRDCFGEGCVPKGGAVWRRRKWKTRALGEVCVFLFFFLFLFWSDVCADSGLQPFSAERAQMCCLFNHLYAWCLYMWCLKQHARGSVQVSAAHQWCQWCAGVKYAKILMLSIANINQQPGETRK